MDDNMASGKINQTMASGNMDPAMVSESMGNTMASENMNSAMTSESMENTMVSGNMQHSMAMENMDNTMASGNIQHTMATGHMDNPMAPGMMDSTMTSDNMGRTALDKQEVAVIGTGPAGLVAAYALKNDLAMKYNVTVFELGDTLTFDGDSYDFTNPETVIKSRVDVPMRILSGRYFTNVFRLLHHLNIHTIERRFTFAFAHDFATVSRYYFIHASNSHRLPTICRRSYGPMGFFSDLWSWCLVMFYFVWFSMSCIYRPPRVRSPTCSTTESIEEYLVRLKLPNFFIEDYIVPIYSTVACAPHKTFLELPAIFLADFKRQTYRQAHRSIPAMSYLQKQLIDGITIIPNARVTFVEPNENHLKLYYHDMETGVSTEMKFDKVVMATDPKQTAAIYPPSSYVMDKLQTCDISVALHRDYDMLPEESMRHVHDASSELLTLQTKIDDWGRKVTLTTHANPHGLLVTSMVGISETMSIDPRKVFHTSKFSTVLLTPETRDAISSLFRQKEGEKDTSTWFNGDDEVYLCGGWAWDGFDSFEGCVWSGLSTARAVGAVLPFEPFERTWHGA